MNKTIKIKWVEPTEGYHWHPSDAGDSHEAYLKTVMIAVDVARRDKQSYAQEVAKSGDYSLESWIEHENFKGRLSIRQKKLDTFHAECGGWNNPLAPTDALPTRIEWEAPDRMTIALALLMHTMTETGIRAMWRRQSIQRAARKAA